jgi:hypothetical protein
MFNFLKRKKKKPSYSALNALAKDAMEKHADEVNNEGLGELELKAIYYGNLINSDYINSDKVALQFILEELDAARQGNAAALNFVNNSGFDEDEYVNSMQNSFEAVDGPNGPQQMLLALIMTVEDMDERVKFRINIVDFIMKKRKLGKYSNT